MKPGDCKSTATGFAWQILIITACHVRACFSKVLMASGHLSRGGVILVGGDMARRGAIRKRMRGDKTMKLNRIKKLITGTALGFMVLFSAGMITGTTAQAQDRDRDRRVDGTERGVRIQPRDPNRSADWSRRQQSERAREIERARQLAWERERANRRPVYAYPRTTPYGYGGYSGGGYGYGRGYGYGNGGYGNGGYGGGSGGYEEQKGYRDGLDRGQEDSRSGRSPNPNNSSHYRSGNSLYRDGFRRGYAVGYRQFGGRRGW
jgi:hypothetical protein